MKKFLKNSSSILLIKINDSFISKKVSGVSINNEFLITNDTEVDLNNTKNLYKLTTNGEVKVTQIILKPNLIELKFDVENNESQKCELLYDKESEFILHCNSGFDMKFRPLGAIGQAFSLVTECSKFSLEDLGELVRVYDVLSSLKDDFIVKIVSSLQLFGFMNPEFLGSFLHTNLIASGGINKGFLDTIQEGREEPAPNPNQIIEDMFVSNASQEIEPAPNPNQIIEDIMSADSPQESGDIFSNTEISGENSLYEDSFVKSFFKDVPD